MRLLFSALFLFCCAFITPKQETAWRHIFASVIGYKYQLVFETPTIISHPVFKNLEPGLHLRIYDEPERYFDQPMAGGRHIKTCFLNNTPDTAYLYQLGCLDGITTEVKKGEEWVSFQRRRWLDDHPTLIPIAPKHYVDIQLEMKIYGRLKVPYRIRLVTTKSVVFSNEILINCSKAQFSQADIPFGDQ